MDERVASNSPLKQVGGPAVAGAAQAMRVRGPEFSSARDGARSAPQRGRARAGGGARQVEACTRDDRAGLRGSFLRCGAGLRSIASPAALVDGGCDVKSGSFLMAKRCEVGLTCCPSGLNDIGVVDFTGYPELPRLGEPPSPAMNRRGAERSATRGHFDFLHFYDTGC